MEKEKRYEEIPAYNQEAQFVVEREPVDMGDYIYIGLEVKDVEIDENNPYDENIEEAEYQDITGEAYTAPAVQPSGSETGITERMQTMETRFDAQERAINDLLISVIPELLGGE